MRRVATAGRAAAHNPAFDHILRKAATTVKQAAQQRYGSVAFEIPVFVHGCPIFKPDACAGYLMHVLSSKGFQVSMRTSSVLIVEWAAPAGGAPPPPAAPPPAEGDRFSRLVGVL